MLNYIYQVYCLLDSPAIFLLLSYTLLQLLEFRVAAKNPAYNKGLYIFYYLAFSMSIYFFVHWIINITLPPITDVTKTPFWLYFICAILLSAFCAHIFLSGTLFIKLVYILYFMTFTQLYKIVCSPLYNHYTSMDSPYYRILDLITAFILYILLFFLAKFFRKMKLSSPFPMTRFQGMLILYFPVSFLIFFGILPVISISPIWQTSILSCILLTNLPVIYYFLATIIHSYEEQCKLNEALSQTHTQLARYRYSLEIQEQVKKERHELKNNYFYIQTLLSEKKYDQLNDYISREIGEKLTKLTDIQTGNALIDYLLNRKIQEAQKFHIKTCTEIIIPAQLSVNEEILCTILLNLLDNAIESSKQEEFPDIQIVMKCVQNYLLCKISNKVSHNILTDNPSLNTTKSDIANHGLGIKIIRSAVESQNGLLNFECEKGYFTATVMLPFTE